MVAGDRAERAAGSRADARRNEKSMQDKRNLMEG